MKRFYIYKITNSVNGKCYVGYTSNPTKRLIEHFSESKSNKTRLIYKAFKKYGKENFELEILYCGLDDEHTLKTMEPYFIREQNSHFIDGYGYNMTYGGDGNLGYKHNDETKKVMKEKRALQEFTDETKKKMSLSHTGKVNSEEHNRNIALARTGTKRSEETRKKLRENWVRRKRLGLPSNQYDKRKQQNDSSK